MHSMNTQQKSNTTNKQFKKNNSKYKDITLQRCLFKQRQYETNYNENVRVVSYNILADSLLYDNLYLYVNRRQSYLPKEKQPYYFAWKYRKELLFQQLLGPRQCSGPQLFDRLNFKKDQLVLPDIICLQEVDHYEDIKDVLQTDFYSGLFKKRTGKRNDGCAIFYREDIFELVDSHIIEFNRVLPNCTTLLSDRLGVSHKMMQNLYKQTPQRIFLNYNEEMNQIECDIEEFKYDSFGSLLDRDNIAIMCLLKKRNNPSKLICVTNTHILFNPKRGDVKILQVDLLIHELIAFLDKNGKSHQNTPIMMCGDFNSSPHSSVYDYVYKKNLNIHPGSPFWRHSLSGLCEELTYPIEFINDIKDLEKRMNELIKDKSPEKAKEIYLEYRKKYYFFSQNKTEDLNSEIFSHPLELKSSNCINGKEPFCTSLHKQGHETVDYIWHSGNIKKVQTLQTSHLPPDALSERVIPNRYHPSDHFMLAAEFQV